MDPKGDLGHLYGAKTTPHMFVIDPNGKLVYAGAIDDKPTTDESDISRANNYVQAALTEATSGKPVTTSSSQPYGCSVKYAQ
jgi:sensor domain CHASE-containing protein